ncbi:alpha-galactosidase [Microbacterium trichothecenolyticum]|uniref:alpha-galactosidase n=1 Tax=Microbacterium trichothecenolyticum TaxID=69370 RepID=UPI001C6F057F|nr:alpha-galactosidase [Microbacterium trichothecenolyticum]MBW9121094.1 alpha-galactosidase [Microbacterium trichothecenolyticum]
MSELRVVHLSSADVSLVVTQQGDELPAIVHWGARLDVSDDDLRTLATMDHRPGLSVDSDVPYRPSVLPEHSRGWFGRPGLSVHRGGRAWSPRFRAEPLLVEGKPAPAGATSLGAGSIVVEASDDWAGIGVVLEIDLTVSGLLRTRFGVRNLGTAADDVDVVEALPSLPVPVRASEILDFSGRWAHERIPQRHPVVRGTHARVSRRGRTGLDATTVLALGVPGFAADAGETWLCHVGFSGDHEHAVERTDGFLAFRGGELLLPGEVRLKAGDEYVTPWIFGAYGEGWDAASARFHAHLRDRNRAGMRPRPVTLNVWEAVYFDQDAATLTELAEQGAALGVERFVLDDGWFRGRRDDRAGLGDWEPDPRAWPDGLRPLADRVRGLGMEFGLWVEPEMINEDSDLARAHPDWILRARDALPARYRFQQVLDLTNPDAYAHIRDRLDALVSEIGVSYLKWDHNRDLVDAGHPATGSPAVHDQTMAVYRLLDDLRRRHPDLEIESCASGGGRVDLGILERTDRIHPSDSHDPVDRFHILRWTGLLVPPEMMGSHVASAVSSTTGRSSTLAYRCAVAFLGHFGIEWDIRGLSGDEREVLSTWIARWRRQRGLISTGRAVSGSSDPADPSLRGVVSPTRDEAIYVVVTPATSADAMAHIRLPGLDPRRRYRLTASAPESLGPPWQVPGWLNAATLPGEDEGGAPVLSGAALGILGLDFPVFHPERAAVLHAEAVS